MRRRFFLILWCVVSLFLVLMGPAWASRLFQEDGIMPNHSADYVRTLNRNASTEVDAAFYNPAGLAYLEKQGLHVQFTSQTYYAKRIHTMDYWGIQVGGGSPIQATQNFTNPAFSGLPKEYTAETTAPCLPSLDIVWKGKEWAVYFDLAITQAAPGLTFNEGLAIMDWGDMASIETLLAAGGIEYAALARRNFARRTEYYIGGTVGGVYKFVEWMSAALGVRYIYASGNQCLSVRNPVSSLDAGGGTIINFTNHPWLIDTDVKGHGAGFIVGLDFKPTEMINIGVKYEYYLPMDLAKKTNKFQAPDTVVSSGNLNVFLDSWAKLPFWEPGLNVSKMNPDTFKNVGNKIRFQYPQTIAMGFSVIIIKGLRAETSGEVSLRPYQQLKGREKDFNVGWKVGQCIEWTFLPKTAVSVGYTYNDFGIKNNKRNEVDPLLTSHTIGGGFKINATEWLDVNLGALYMIYKPVEVNPIEFTNISTPTNHFIRKTLDEKRFSIAIGFTVRLFTGTSTKEEPKEQI